MPLDFRYNQEQLAAQAARLGQIFGIEDAARKISPNGFHIETLSPEIATVTVTMQRHIPIDEALRLLNATPIEEAPFLTGERIRIAENATPGELRAGARRPPAGDSVTQREGR